MSTTTYKDVLMSFKGLPSSKYKLPDELLYQWFLDALATYELELYSLNFDPETMTFQDTLKQYQIKTLSTIMYTYYLTKELSRLEKLQGISTKSISLSGNDTSKRVTFQDLEFHKSEVDRLLNKQKRSCNS